MKKKSEDTDEFRWIAFQRKKVINFSIGDVIAKQTLQKGTRIRVLAHNRKGYFDIVTAMGWFASLSPEDFVFVDAPKPVIESYPAPFDGVLQSTRWDGSRWIIPDYFNGLPVIGDKRLNLPAKETRKPVVRLSLNRGADKKLVYRVGSFAVE